MPQISRLWVGMLTQNSRNAGTDSSIVLIVDRGDGVDALHHTFLDTSQYDQERGQANLYVLGDVSGNDIDTDRLDSSSVRVGIRGADRWQPQVFFVWGNSSDGILPIAIETGIGVRLSTDKDEGNLSIPVRPVSRGSGDMQINRLLILMTTSGAYFAGTNHPITLQISAGGGLVVNHTIPDTPQRDQERYQANLYFVPVDSPFTWNGLAADAIRLSIGGGDLWLPDKFFLFGLDDSTGRPESLVPLVALNSWTFGRLSTNPIEGSSTVTLPVYSVGQLV